MHELAIAEGILAIVVTEAQTRYVTAVNIVLGDLLSIAEEPIKFCFQIAAKGTRAEGATLSIIRVPVALRCRKCRSEFGLERHGVCPMCGIGNGEVVRGRECYVDSMEVREPSHEDRDSEKHFERQ